jgi:hypothetical protein
MSKQLLNYYKRRDQKLEYQTLYNEKNYDSVKSYQKEYYNKNKDIISKRNKLAKEINKDHFKIHSKRLKKVMKELTDTYYQENNTVTIIIEEKIIPKIVDVKKEEPIVYKVNKNGLFIMDW